MNTNPPVVCLCGSTRFYQEFQQAEYELTMQGNIYLSVGFYAHAQDAMNTLHGEGVGITPEQKQALDELHLRKIDLADYVYVVNKDGYIGDSTRREIQYAMRHGKPVVFLEDAYCGICGGSISNPVPLGRGCVCVAVPATKESER